MRPQLRYGALLNHWGRAGWAPLMGKSTENPAGFGHFSGMFWIANAESFDLEGGITGKTDKNWRHFQTLPVTLRLRPKTRW